MKNQLFLLALALFSGSLFAQPSDADMEKRKEKMEAMKAAFITAEIELTPEEAQAFWPIYNEREDKIHALRHENHQKMMKDKKAGKKLEDYSDAELEKMMAKHLENEEKIAKINTEYHSRFLKVLGAKKTAKLYKAEKDFLRDIMRKHKKGHGEKRMKKGE